MNTAEQLSFKDDNTINMELRKFINEGLKDAEDGNLFEAKEVFDKLEERYEKL